MHVELLSQILSFADMVDTGGVLPVTHPSANWATAR